MIQEAAGPAVEAWRAVAGGAGTAEDLAGILLRETAEALLAATECEPGALDRTVDRACELIAALPGQVVDEYMTMGGA